MVTRAVLVTEVLVTGATRAIEPCGKRISSPAEILSGLSMLFNSIIASILTEYNWAILKSDSPLFTTCLSGTGIVVVVVVAIELVVVVVAAGLPSPPPNSDAITAANENASVPIASPH